MKVFFISRVFTTAPTLLMRMAEGAPGKPGMHVLKAATSEKEPLPQELMPHTRNLYALPGCSSTFCTFRAAVAGEAGLVYETIISATVN